jgi:hypothetical protein
MQVIMAHAARVRQPSTAAGALKKATKFGCLSGFESYFKAGL